MVKMVESLKSFKQIAFFCFIADLAITIWSYYQIKNYDAYLKIVKPMIDSPDFQVQIYAVLLQSFLFSALLFLAIHAVIYILFIKKIKYSIKYVRFYTLLAAVSSAIMIFTGYPIAMLALIIYALAFYSTGRLKP